MVQLIAIAAISGAWFTGRLPDWRYPLGAIVLIAVPEAFLTLVERFLSTPRHPRP